MTKEAVSYADRKGWSMNGVTVAAGLRPATGNEVAKFLVTLALPGPLDVDQVDRLVAVAGRCPLRRTFCRHGGLVDRVAR